MADSSSRFGADRAAISRALRRHALDVRAFTAATVDDGAMIEVVAAPRPHERS